MIDENAARMLERAARVAISNTALIGSSLHRLTFGSGDLRHAAQEAGLSHESILRLALCYRPRPAQWLDDVQRLARATTISPDVLVAVLRQLEALEALTADDHDHLLLAARRDYKVDASSDDPADGVPPRHDDVDPER